MNAVLDKDMVKEALRELIHEEPETFKTMLKEILAEMLQQDDTAKQTKRQRLEQIVNEDFAEYEAVFRALA